MHTSAIAKNATGGEKKATKRIVVTQLPNILIIHLKRFEVKRIEGIDISRKKETQVKYEEKLHIGKEDGERKEYELISIVEHHGESCHKGHYIAYGKRRGTWYRYNDENVEEVRKEEALARGKEVYILM